MHRRFAFALVLALAACKEQGPPAAESCGVADDGHAYDVAGRADGLYGLKDDRLEAMPLARLDRLTRTGEGVEAQSGKRWIGVHLPVDEARALRDYTADAATTRKKMAVVAGGEIASVHKVRQPLTSADMQVSCCNPRACDRWNAILSRAK